MPFFCKRLSFNYYPPLYLHYVFIFICTFTFHGLLKTQNMLIWHYIVFSDSLKWFPLSAEDVPGHYQKRVKFLFIFFVLCENWRILNQQCSIRVPHEGQCWERRFSAGFGAVWPQSLHFDLQVTLTWPVCVHFESLNAD